MRKVVGGKVYNSKTADELAKVESFRGGSQSWYQERLFRTPTGEHFLMGIGGPLTRWNDDIDIVPLNQEQLDHWLRKRRAKVKGGPNAEA